MLIKRVCRVAFLVAVRALDVPGSFRRLLLRLVDVRQVVAKAVGCRQKQVAVLALEPSGLDEVQVLLVAVVGVPTRG